MIASIILSITAATTVSPPALSCDLATTTMSARTLHDTLARRAVRLVAMASHATDNDTDAVLRRLVSADAQFKLGGGDVGRPLGTGIRGAKALAAMMHANQFRYLGWDYMDGPSNGCSKHSITVEFVDISNHTTSSVNFLFEEGRIIEADGWQRSFTEGTLQNQELIEKDGSAP